MPWSKRYDNGLVGGTFSFVLDQIRVELERSIDNLRIQGVNKGTTTV